MKSDRSAGIILHPTSLPGPDGIGDLGPEAYRWLDFLADTDCLIWQVLPLGPTGYGDSPYQCFSAFAGNPYLISPSVLMEKGLLMRSDLADRPAFPIDEVPYGDAIAWKLMLLRRAYERFKSDSHPELQNSFQAFQDQENWWLEDYVLFKAIKEKNGGNPWNKWPSQLRD